MSRPAFLFYPGDWTRSANLRRCSAVARAAWIDVMCLMHDSDVYGVLHWPLSDVARSIGSPLRAVRELVDKHVMKGVDRGPCEPLVYVPRSGRREGAPVILVPIQSGPVWYSSRMVKDEYIRLARGSLTRFEADDRPPKPSPMSSPKGGIGATLSDGPSFALSLSGSSLRSEPSESSAIADVSHPAEKPPDRDPPHPHGEAGSEDSEAPKAGRASNGNGRLPPCPVEAIVEAYHEQLPQLPRCLVVTDTRRRAISGRWRQYAVENHWTDRDQGVVFFREFFAFVGRSKFLTGQVSDRTGRTFTARLDWLMRAENWAKTVEGTYHG